MAPESKGSLPNAQEDANSTRRRLHICVTDLSKRTSNIAPIARNEMFPDFKTVATTDWIPVRNGRLFEVRLDLVAYDEMRPDLTEEVRTREEGERGEGHLLFTGEDLNGNRFLTSRLKTPEELDYAFTTLTLLAEALPTR